MSKAVKGLQFSGYFKSVFHSLLRCGYGDQHILHPCINDNHKLYIRTPSITDNNGHNIHPNSNPNPYQNRNPNTNPNHNPNPNVNLDPNLNLITNPNEP